MVITNNSISCCGIKKIEIDFSGEHKKVFIDDKEIDSRKVLEMRINISSGVIGLNATLSECGLPIKE